MKKCSHLLAMVALFGLAMPVIAAPQEVAVDDQPVVSGEMDADEVAELEEEGGWSFGGSVWVEGRSKYVSYGIVDNPHAILVPGVEFAISNDDYFTLAVGVESVFDTTNYGAKDDAAVAYGDRRWKYMELDPYLTLSRSWSLWDDTSLYTEVGYFYEYHPRACSKADLGYNYPDAQYLTFKIGLEDNFLNPTFSLEYQLTGADWGDDWSDGKGAVYATFDISHEFDLSETLGMEEGSLCLTPTLGIAMANKERNMCDLGVNESLSLRDAYARLELSYTPVEGLSIAPYVSCHQQLDSDTRDVVGDDDFVAYVGLGLSYEF
jgi:hypothetical protein